jgi:nucleotide-binding universal stress UspA family protein
MGQTLARKGIGAMKKFQKILVPTDLSEASNRALEYAFTMASALDIEMLILHVVDSRTLQSMPYAYDQLSEDFFDKLSHDDMAAEVKKVLQAEKEKGVTYDHKLRVTTLVRYGVPYDQIIKTAEAEKVDFIVMGAKGASAVAEIFLGGVAEKVSRRAPCPVFLVRERQAQAS